MKFSHYTNEALKTSIYPSGGIIGLSYTALGLVGEAGEVAERIKKLIRDDEVSSPESVKEALKYKRDAIIKELGDVLWYINAMCSELDTDLSEVAQVNLDKLKSRMDRGRIKGSGDNR